MTFKKVTPVLAGRTSGDQSSMRRVQAFHPAYHTALQDLCANASAIEDLTESFPALLFALATGYGTARKRSACITMIAAGAPLRACAKTLGMPWWTRRLPAGSFTHGFNSLPSGPGVDAHMAQLVPACPQLANSWLSRVIYADEANCLDFALWVAKNNKSHAPLASSETFIFLTPWAWFAGQPGTQGHSLLRKPWSASMGLRRAVDEMTHWRRRIALMAKLGNGVADTWIAEGNALGYDFVALRKVEDFVAESEAMDNCLDQYADYLESDATRIFSIRKAGKPLADIEIGPHGEEPRMPALIQLRGPRNRRASAELWQATYAWLGGAALKLLPGNRARLRGASKRRQARRLFWQPYLEALKGTEHLERFKLLALGGVKRCKPPARRSTVQRTAEARD